MVLKVGVVGQTIGKIHAESYIKDPLSELVAVCDIIKEKADAGANKYGVKSYYSLQDMLERETDLDIIDVCTGGHEWGSLHYEPTMLALKYGKHVLVEKPLSNDIYEAREMVAKARQKKLYFGCDLNHYFTSAAEIAKIYMDDGKVGELVYCFHRMGFLGGEKVYSGPPGLAKFRGYPHLHLKGFFPHIFSVVRYFCGDIAQVQAFFERPSYRKKAGDVMLSINSIHVKFVNGCIGYLFSTAADTTFGLGGWWNLEVGGSLGTFCIENCLEKVTYWQAPKPGEPSAKNATLSPEPVVTYFGTTNLDQTIRRRIHAFLEDITNDVPREQLRASGRDALAAQECMWAAIESYEQGGIPVRPNPLPPL